MAFYLASASPVEQETGFDLASATPVATRKTPKAMAAERPDEEPVKNFRTSGEKATYNPVTAVGETLANMATGFAGKVEGDIAGLAALAKEKISPSGGDPMAFKKAVQRRLTAEPETEGGQILAADLAALFALLVIFTLVHY